MTLFNNGVFRAAPVALAAAEEVSKEWGDHAALADRSFWLACG